MYSCSQVRRIITSRRLIVSLLQPQECTSAKSISHKTSLVSYHTQRFRRKELSTGAGPQYLSRVTMSNHSIKTAVPAADKKTKKLIRTKYKDVLVKAGDDVYYLDRLKLALKSAYFENLFLSPDWNDETTEPINVPLDSDTFGAVVDVIYGSSWSSVLNIDNYVSVLKAKHDLKIMNDSYNFSHFISKHLKNTPKSKVKVFEMFNFVVGNDALKSSLQKIHTYLVKNLEHFQDHKEFLSLPIDHFVQLLTSKEPYEHDCVTYYRSNLRCYYSNKSSLANMCAKWICHDFENRLPLVVKVANGVLQGLKCLTKRIDPNIKVQLSNIDEQDRHEVVRRYFKRLLMYGTVLDPVVYAPPVEKRKHYDSHVDRDDRKEIKKLMEYLENGTLYDITVKVQEKAYKLHRSILESKSGYFRELFSTEYAEATAQYDGIPNLPNKDKEYVIEEIDEATFDIVVEHIYSDKLPFDKDESFPLFKAACILKIDELINRCKSNIDYNIDQFDSEGRIQEVLDYAQGKKECKDLYLKYLRRHVRNSWPDISHKADFYSISWKNLEKWLLSFDFMFDDAKKIVDLCSAWIMHDLKTRYKLIQQVALAIKLYGLPDYEDYKIELPTDLDSISQEMIRDELLNIVSSLSLIPASNESKVSSLRKFDNEPVFVSLNWDGILEIQDINFDPLAKLNFGEKYCSMSATTIDDNLFILYENGWSSYFLAYNGPSNRFIELGTYEKYCMPKNVMEENCTLLNRRNELYCCSSGDGSMLKYSFELNRWMRFSKSEPNMEKIRYTGDGEKIYRLYRVPGSETNPAPGHNVEWYDFEQNQWSSLSRLPSPLPEASYYRAASNNDEIVSFTVINGTDPAVLLESVLLWYDLNSHEWRHLELSSSRKYCSSMFSHSARTAIAQGENGIAQIHDNELYHYSNSKKAWELQKVIAKVPINIVAVNKPRVSSRLIRCR